MKSIKLVCALALTSSLVGVAHSETVGATTESSSTVPVSSTSVDNSSSSVVEPSSSSSQTEPSASTTEDTSSSTLASSSTGTVPSQSFSFSSSSVSQEPSSSTDTASSDQTQPAMEEDENAPRFISGSFARGDDYPYKHIPFDQIYIDPWRFYHRQCTSFVAWRLQEVNGFKIPFHANASEWKPLALKAGYRVDNKPAVGSVAYWSGNHVSWVSGVQGNYVEIEEYNYGFTGKYNKRIIPISQVEAFIHFKDVAPTKPVLPQSVQLSKSSHTLSVGSSYILTATIAPANVTNPALTWKSSNPKVATVENGRVKTLAVGTTYISVTTASGNKTAKMKLVVQKASNQTTTATYRLYHSGIKRHLYTQNVDEALTLKERGWSYEGESFQTAATGVEVYRLYHPGTREHIYTTNVKEKDILPMRGWNYEGVAFRSGGKKPVYRLYHAGLKVHLYTTDLNEKNTLVQRGWADEGISFYTV